MVLGRNKCVIKGGPNQKVMQHDEFIDRIRKSLYFGADTHCDDMEVSGPLAEYASELFSEPHKGHSLNRLNKVTAGNVRASPCSLIMALIYLDRLNATDSGYVRRITPSELFIVSMMISTKFYLGHDEVFYLSDWAADGGIAEDHLKELELEFLCAINWNIYISNEQFFNKLAIVEKTLAQRQGLRRGWLTYTELVQFLPSFTLAKFLLNNITVMALTYAASVMTIAGAFFLVSQIPGNALHHSHRKNGSTDNSGSDLVSFDGNESLLHTITNSDSTEISNNRYPGLNVEEELRKLEFQYLKEQYLDMIRMKNNENDGPLQRSHSKIEPNPRQRGVMHDSEIHWYAFKDEYSDEESRKCSDLSNCTKSILWSLVDDTANTISKIPFMWFKFM